MASTDNNISKPKRGIEVTHPFHHSMPVQLRFNDIDVLGHVNNSIYFQLFDLAKSRYFDAVNGTPVKWSEADIVVANVNCDFLMPTWFNEPLAVETLTEHIHEKSLRMIQRLVNTDTGEVKCVCAVVMVGFDVATSSAQPIAEHWRSGISAFEGRDVCSE